MKLVITPGQRRVYVGQPLRLDFRWSCALSTKRLRTLRCDPQFFTMPGVDVVVPRSTVPKEQQIGLPIGGRRVIAHRIPGDGRNLGEVEFSFYLSFDAPGEVSLPAVRLECVHLRDDGGAFAPYAAYFNNGLFERVDEETAFDRVFTESESIGIEILPLPAEGRLESFSGLFAPCEIDVSVKPTECTVGQVLEVDLHVRAAAPHGMLELPDLGRQAGLRSWFKLDREMGRAWDPAGTRFRVRARTLTTRITSLPPLDVQVFDPVRGEYAMVRTAAVPLQVRADAGRDYFDAKSLGSATASLSDQPEGVWQNENGSFMSDALNTLSGFLAGHFWLLMLLGPVLFVVLLPWVRERRRRAVDASYRRRVTAYRAFRRLPEGSEDKWVAFHGFLATCFGVEPKAWTVGDARRRLADLGVNAEDVAAVVDGQKRIDAKSFSPRGASARLPDLNALARRVARLLRNSGALLVVLLSALISGQGWGSVEEWDAAMKQLDQAEQADPASRSAAAVFSGAALKFESLARSGFRPGPSWSNAGNAWFEAGEVGRAIASYRQAQIYRPFDQSVRDNLAAVRALSTDVVEPAGRPSLLAWPKRWLTAVLVPTALGFWGLLLAFVRHRKRTLLVGCATFLLASLGLAGLIVVAHVRDGRTGVVVVSEVFGRKGPSYRYRTAFHEPLHDGLEFAVLERRDEWIKVQLADHRRCWIPSDQAQLITN